MSTLTAPTSFLPAGPALGRRPAGPSRATRVRWDRVGALLLALLVFTWLLVAGTAGSSQADTAPQPAVRVVVQPGDTIWDMARQHAPAGMSTLEYVMLVEQHNEVRAGALLPGTVLRLPQG